MLVDVVLSELIRAGRPLTPKLKTQPFVWRRSHFELKKPRRDRLSQPAGPWWEADGASPSRTTDRVSTVRRDPRPRSPHPKSDPLHPGKWTASYPRGTEATCPPVRTPPRRSMPPLGRVRPGQASVMLRRVDLPHACRPGTRADGSAWPALDPALLTSRVSSSMTGTLRP